MISSSPDLQCVRRTPFAKPGWVGEVLDGRRGKPFPALLMGNLCHLVAVGMRLASSWLFADHMGEPMVRLGQAAALGVASGDEVWLERGHARSRGTTLSGY